MGSRLTRRSAEKGKKEDTLIQNHPPFQQHKNAECEWEKGWNYDPEWRSPDALHEGRQLGLQITNYGPSFAYLSLFFKVSASWNNICRRQSETACVFSHRKFSFPPPSPSFLPLTLTVRSLFHPSLCDSRTEDQNVSKQDDRWKREETVKEDFVSWP
jgi:hypothetical protein